MFYNLKLFGDYIRRKRKKLHYTQKDIYNLSNISLDTQRKIENGLVLPTHTTLELLSTALKEDLNLILLDFRLDDFNNYKKIITNLEHNIFKRNYDELIYNYRDLTIMSSNIPQQTYVYNIVKQYLALVKSIIINSTHINFKCSVNNLLLALKITIPRFSLNKYNSYYYNDLELRILMNIGIIINELGHFEQSRKIFQFCLEQMNDNNSIFKLKLLFNISKILYNINLGYEALSYINKCIKICQNYNEYTFIALFYSQKALISFSIGENTYLETLEECIILNKIFYNNLSIQPLKICKIKYLY